ncbi:MAG TPA: S-adenosylmethionine:tRNA ribosyltransferase-isomerase, partial [Nitrospiria bacterium]|nr:S-adenosylmethionine:tRNA ribosyltransferase-isomerase [Nitrospiria bacterium]
MTENISPDRFLLSGYDFHLPEHLIAQSPAEPRDASRLLVLEKKTGFIRHCRFSDFPELLGPDDLLILNETRVRPARLEGKKIPSGGRVSVLLLKELAPHSWEALVRGNPGVGQEVEFGPEIRAVVREDPGGGKRILDFLPVPGLNEKLEERGLPPLPPYIRRAPGTEDRSRYQTVYANQAGSLAAPTAGLHFSVEVLERLRKNGTEIRKLTLHVGTGTFLPVRSEDI